MDRLHDADSEKILYRRYRENVAGPEPAGVLGKLAFESEPEDSSLQFFLGFFENGGFSPETAAQNDQLERQTFFVKFQHGLEKFVRVLVVLPSVVPQDSRGGGRRLVPILVVDRFVFVEAFQIQSQREDLAFRLYDRNVFAPVVVGESSEQRRKLLQETVFVVRGVEEDRVGSQGGQVVNEAVMEIPLFGPVRVAGRPRIAQLVLVEIDGGWNTGGFASGQREEVSQVQHVGGEEQVGPVISV